MNGVDAIHSRHLEIDENNIGAQLLEHRKPLLPIGGLTNDLHVRSGLQRKRNPIAQQWVIVNDQDVNWLSLCRI
jgi:hypothetical protein